MLVVEINSTGAEIFAARTAPGVKECFVVKLRCGRATDTSMSFGGLARLVVKARESDVDMFAKLSRMGS
jgi:hypothetical protein